MTGESLRQRCGAHRDRVLLSESTIQSSELQVEMREDVEALTVRLQEAGESNEKESNLISWARDN